MATIKTYFKDPRLSMTIMERFLFRIISYTTYGVIIAASLTFLMSDIGYLRWSGVLLALFIIDRIINRYEGYKTISKTDKNLSLNLSPYTRLLIERALDKTSLNKGTIEIHILDLLIDHPNISKAFNTIKISKKELEQVITNIIERDKTNTQSKKESLVIIEKIIKLAYQEAKKSKRRFIAPEDLFIALLHIDNKEIANMKKIFQFLPKDVKTNLNTV